MSSFSHFSSPNLSITSQNKRSRSVMIQNYLDAVPQWKDDILIQSLFANLPNPEVKPEAYVQKYSFWKDILIGMTRARLLCGSVFKLETKDLSSLFKRGGLQPICLNSVIYEMLLNDLVADMEEFNKEKMSSVITWLYDSLKTMVIGSRSPTEYREDFQELKVPNSVLIHPLIIEQKCMLLEHMAEANTLTNQSVPITFSEFQELVNESRKMEGLVEIVEKFDFVLLLKFMKSEGILNYSPMKEIDTDDSIIAIKFRSEVKPIDLDIVKMKILRSKLNMQVRELSDKIFDLSRQAKEFITKKDRKMAMYQLKHRSLLEKQQTDRLNSLHTIDEILLRINSASDDLLILEAYKSGALTLKSLLPDAVDVSDAVSIMQEMIADHDEITQIFNQPMSINEFDTDLEAELEALSNLNVPSISRTVKSTSEVQKIEEMSTMFDKLYVSDSEEKCREKSKERVLESA